jgi:hypothetical protein
MAQIDISYRDGRFFMLGLIHRDPEVTPLLSRWMEGLRPDVITLEFSQYGYRFRKSRGAELSEKVREAARAMDALCRPMDRQSLDDLLAYINLPAEFAAASGYCERRTIPLHLIDMDLYSQVRLSRIDELVSRENLDILLSGPQPQDAGRERALARLFFRKGVKLFTYTEEMGKRDRHMRDRIAELMAHPDTPRVLHVCGWQHLADPHGLYSSLGPKKVFIHDEALHL